MARKKRALVVLPAVLLILTLALPASAQTAKAPRGKWSSAQQVAIDFLSDPAVEKKMAEMNDAIWSYAELGLEEYNTASLAKSVLKEAGFSIEEGVAGMPTAFVATYSSGPGPVIGIHGELDALPMISQKQYATNQDPVLAGAPGHGCTHNTMITAATAAVLAVKGAMEQGKFTGTIKLFGSPAEETLISRPYMVKAGLYKGVDAVIDNHGGGSFDSSYGRSGNAMFSFAVTFNGKTAHSAGAPWTGRSALDAVELMNVATNYLREHFYFTHRMHYVIVEGGEAPNVVPDRATVWYFVRDTDDRVVEDFKRVINCAKAAALATDTTYEIIPYSAIHQRYENEALARIIQENIKKVGYPKWTEEEIAFAKELQRSVGAKEVGLYDDAKIKPEPSGPPAVFTGGGSSDVAEVSVVVPMAGVSFPSSIPGAIGHHWSTVAVTGTSIAHKGLMAGAKVMATTAIELMTDRKKLEALKADFEAMKKEYPAVAAYQSYLEIMFKEAGKPVAPPVGFLSEMMKKYRSKMAPFYLTPDWYEGPIVTQ
jgi:aminobenzoyl-glutamate utilization protein B